MNPFHFGTSDKRLFGVYHPAPAQRSGSLGVVVCPPARDEYTMAHRALRQLASRLAGMGVPALRFDYFGTGDSFGACDEGRTAQWRQDIGVAIDELKTLSGVPRVALVGMRLGAALAAMAAGERRTEHDVSQVVLWDPVVFGDRYVQALRARHDAFLHSAPPGTQVASEPSDGLFGFPLTDEILADLETVDLTRVTAYPENRVYIVVSRRTTECDELRRALAERETEAVFEDVKGLRVWEKDVLLSRELVPTAAIRRITSWVA